MQKINTETLKEIEDQYAKWGEYLNSFIGLLSFQFALSCLGTNRPDITGFISLIFLTALGLYGRKRFPEKIRELRKEELSKIDKMTLSGIEKKYFGFKSLFQFFPIYVIGWTFLTSVSLYGIYINQV